MRFSGGGPELQRARNKAAGLISKYRIRKPEEISEYLDLIAWDAYKAIIQEKPIDSCEARVTRAKRGSVIVVNQRSNDGRKRFSVAHELGHIALHGRINQMAACSKLDIFKYRRARPEEREANVFASELLMPTTLVEDYCEDYEPSMELVDDIQNDFKVSMTAAAIRMVECSWASCALVASEGKRISWSMRSKTFLHGVREGELSKDSFAIEVHHSSEVGTATEAKQNYASRWLIPKGCQWITEQSINLGRFGVLTLIWDYERDS